MKRILIVEDEFSIAMDIEMRLQNLEYNPVGIASNYHEAIGMAADHNPDLVLMDINLDGSKTGIEAADSIRNMFNIPVVFLTANADPATFESANSVKPFGFVLKPFKDIDLKNNIEIAFSRHKEYIEHLKEIELHKKSLSEIEQMASGDSLFIKEKGQMVRLELNTVIRLEALDNYTLLFTESGKKVITGFLKDVLAKLSPNRFIRVHRSHAVAISKIDRIEDNLVYLGDTAIPVSKSYRSDLNDKIKVI